MKHILSLSALAFLVANGTALAASFNCANAHSAVEKMVCADPLLNKLDETLADNYFGMMHSDFGGSPKALKAEQRRWVAARNQCKTKQCLVNAYRKRVDETCGYGVITGLHPICKMSEEVH